MIDLQTYRVRIARGPDIVSNILHRKERRYKLRGHETQRHEDEDLLRKLLKTVPPSHISYFVLIVLLLIIHIAKYSIKLPAALHIEYYNIQHIFSSHHKTMLEYKFTVHSGLGFAVDSALSIVCLGTCMSSVGAVHFIAILLLIAGIEPNPGPKKETPLPVDEEDSTKITIIDGRLHFCFNPINILPFLISNNVI